MYRNYFRFCLETISITGDDQRYVTNETKSILKFFLFNECQPKTIGFRVSASTFRTSFRLTIIE